MKVCFICNQIAAWGKIGGFGSMARMIGRELVKKGVEVTVVCRRRGSQRRHETLDGMRVVGLNTRELLTSRSVFEAVDADIYHSQEPTIGTWLAQRARPQARHVVTCIDPRDDDDWHVEFKHSTFKRKLIYAAQRYYEDGRRVHAAVRDADQVCCQARFLIPKVMTKYGLRASPLFLPNPIDVGQAVPQKSERPTCCFVGRFDPRKRPELFFECVRRNRAVRFIAVGRAHDAGYDALLRRKFGALPNLELTGFVDPFHSDALARIYAESWVLINTAAREGLPATFLEAGAQGCALLAEVDPDEMTSRFGLRVTDGDFSAGLQELFERDRWRSVGRAAFEYVQTTFGTPHAIRQHMELYERLLSAAPSPRDTMEEGRHAA